LITKPSNGINDDFLFATRRAPPVTRVLFTLIRGKPKREFRKLPQPAFHINAAAVFENDFSADGQAQAGTALRSFRCEKGLENPLTIRLGDPHPPVVKPDP
jgi:hypothetical protein